MSYPWHKPMLAMRRMVDAKLQIRINLRRANWASNYLESAYYYGMLSDYEGKQPPPSISLFFEGEQIQVGEAHSSVPGLRCTEIKVSRHPFFAWYCTVQAVFQRTRFIIDPATQLVTYEVVR